MWSGKSSAGEPSEIVQFQKTSSLPPSALQEIWFATLRFEWSSLVVVPADSHCSAMPIADALARMATLHRGKQMTMVTTTGLDLTRTSELMTSLAIGEGMVERDRGNMRPPLPWFGRDVVLAVDPLPDNPAGLAVALAADAAILCVRKGKTTLRSAQRSLDLVGAEKFIGCVLED